MKIGILIRGISYGRGTSGKDFRTCIYNYMKHVYEPLSENHEVSVYICTYTHHLIDEVREIYKPKKMELIDFEGSNQVTTFRKSLDILKGEDLDFVISTRFDLFFNDKITDINIDYTKSNFTFRLDPSEARWIDYEFISDLAFYFPYNHLNAMISATDDLIKFPPRVWPDLHGIYKFLKKYLPEDQIQFITPNIWRQQGDEYPVYQLIRANI